MQRLASSLQGALLNRAWIQWAALGIDATVERDDAVVDPEALIVLTAELGDADARLRDLSTDWCVTYGRYVNGSRLKQVARELGTPDDIIGEYVATVAASGGPAWPMATRPRRDYVRRDKARLDSAESRPRLRIRLRAAFGVNARADILAGAVGCVARRPQRRRPGSRHAVHEAERRLRSRCAPAGWPCHSPVRGERATLHPATEGADIAGTPTTRVAVGLGCQVRRGSRGTPILGP